MDLLDLFPETHLVLDLRARDKKAALKEIAQHLARVGTIAEDAGRKLERALNKRESEASTGIGKGLAIPHAKNCNFISQMVAVFARSREGINFDSIDGAEVQLLFMVASPADQSDVHLRIMRKIANVHKDDKTLKFLKTTDKIESVIDILKELDEIG